MNSTKMFLKLSVLLGLILIFAYLYNLEEHLPAIVMPAYEIMINFLEMLLLVAIIITIAFALIDLVDLDRFQIKRL
ncbi:hypothetical protein ACNF42_06685 [Cuniculiplasma sp. SKW3]|uniref:hypothetical protein n=1 Tax=Cuniculiplasma sp. SKW3 TaxID=3400170 RepID=UPI003FCFA8E4